MTAWKLPLAVSGIALPIVAGFYVGGPGLGMAVGALATATIVFLAVRKPPLGEMAIAPAPDECPRLLVVLDAALGAVGAAAIAALVDDTLLAGALPQVLLLAPCRSSFAERWTSDLEPGRERARADLAKGVSTLAELGIAASARVGDEDTVQTTEDTLRSFAATEVVLVEGKDGGVANALRARLTVPFHQAQAAGRSRAERAPSFAGQRTSYGRILGNSQLGSA